MAVQNVKKERQELVETLPEQDLHWGIMCSRAGAVQRLCVALFEAGFGRVSKCHFSNDLRISNP
jgi:hypothetical protein